MDDPFFRKETVWPASFRCRRERWAAACFVCTPEFLVRCCWGNRCKKATDYPIADRGRLSPPSATSMGRLILNVLLSFAQFEREIIAERTRDKIAATRR